MPNTSPPRVRTLSDHERVILENRTKSPNAEHARVAKIVILSAGGKSAEAISDELALHSETVRRWINRFNARGLEGITPSKRGPKLRFLPEQREQIIRVSNTPPSEFGLAFSAWTSVKLARYLAEQRIVSSISHVSVRHILMEGNAAAGEVSTGRRERQTAPTAESWPRGAVHSSGAGAAVPVKASESDQAPPRVREALSAAKQSLTARNFREVLGLLTPLLTDSSLSPDEEATVRCLLGEAHEGAGAYAEMRKALEVYESPERRGQLSPLMLARTRLKLGWAYSLERDYPRAFARLNEALRILVELNDAQGSSETHYALGRTYIEINEYKIARDHLLEAVHYQRFENDRDLLARIYLRLGLVDYYEGDFARAKSHYLSVADLARQSSDHRLLGQLSMNLGLVAMYDEFPDRAEATKRFHDAIVCFEKVGERDYVGLAYNNLADNLIHIGDWEKAEECLRAALGRESQSDCGIKYQAIALATLGELACFRGRYEQAKSYLDESLELLPHVGSKWVEGVVQLVLGNYNSAIRKDSTALEHMNLSLQISTSLGNQFGVIMAHISLAELFLSSRNVPRARDHHRVAEQGLKQNSALTLSGRLKRLHGSIDAADGHLADSVQHLSQSVAAFATAQDVFEEARSRLDLGRVLLTIREDQPAETELKQALAIFERLGATPFSERTKQLVAEKYSRPAHQSTAVHASSPFGSAAALSQQSADPGRSPGIGARSEVSAAAAPLLLMERLLDAAGSRELILQELISIAEYVYRECQPLKIIVYKPDESRTFQPVILRGCSSQEAESLSKEIKSALATGRTRDSSASVAVLSAGERATVAVYLWSGSRGFLDLDLLRPFLKQAELALENCALRSLRRAAVPAPSEAIKYSVREAIPGFLFASAAMAEVIEKIQKIRRSDVTVLITGESGTGKELVARTIHAESARCNAIFLPFNCTAVSPEIVESQLFGHRRGSFTGAVDHYQGIVRAAEGGTLFLDEIGDLSLTVQPKLLRFMQEGEIQPVGQAKPQKVDVRVVTATNTDLEKAVAEGRFREDLYHRLNIIRIHVPPLRDRPEEVPVLTEYYLEHFGKRAGREGLAFSRDVLNLFLAYDWPGNVRQLRNEIERAVAYAGSESVITASELSAEILRPRRSKPQKI